MTFSRARGIKIFYQSKVGGLYCDQLREAFAEAAGLEVALYDGRMERDSFSDTSRSAVETGYREPGGGEMKRDTTSSKVQIEERRSPSSSAHPSQQLGGSSDSGLDRSVRFTAACGKVVDYIRYTGHPTEQQAVEARFTDGTFLYFEPLPRVSFRVRYLKTHRGNIKSVRNYGVLPE